MPAVAIGAVASVASGAMAASSAKSAAKTQAAAADRATEAQREMFERQVELQQPWRDAGGAGLNRLAYEMGLSPTGFYQQGGASGGVGGSTGGNAVAPMETEAQIRERLRAQFTRPATQTAQPAGNIYGNAFEGSDQGITGYGFSAAFPAQTAQAAQAGTAGGFDQAGYDAAVNAELARLQQSQQQQAQATATASTDPMYGNLLRDFSKADFEVDPGYGFRQEEGEKAIQRAAAAQGGVGSGKFLKDAMRFNQGLASQEYGTAFDRFNVNKTNRFNRLASVSGVGQTAANQTGAAASNFGSQMGSNIIGAGNAMAAGKVGAANAWGQGIGQGVSMYQQNALMDRIFPATGTPINPFATGSTPGGGGNYNWGGGF